MGEGKEIDLSFMA